MLWARIHLYKVKVVLTGALSDPGHDVGLHFLSWYEGVHTTFEVVLVDCFFEQKFQLLSRVEAVLLVYELCAEERERRKVGAEQGVPRSDEDWLIFTNPDLDSVQLIVYRE